MTQIILLFQIFICGFVVAKIMRLTSVYSFILAYPLGLGIFSQVILISFAIDLDIFYGVCLVIFLTLLACIKIYLKKSTKEIFNLKSLKTLIFFIIFTFICFAFNFIEIPFVKLTSDSFDYHGIGKIFSNNLILDVSNEDFFRYSLRRDPMLFTVSALSNSLGIQNFQLHFFLVGIFLFLIVLMPNLDDKTNVVDKISIFFLTISCVISPQLIHQSAFYLPNLTAAVYYGAIFILAQKIISFDVKNKDQPFKYLIIFCFIASIGCILRTEIRYLNILVLVPTLICSLRFISSKKVYFLIAFYLVLSHWWYIYRFILIPNPYDALYGTFVVDFLSIALTLFGFFLIQFKKKFYSSKFIIFILTSVLLLILALDFSGTIFTIKRLTKLMFFDGNWGLTWFLILPIFILLISIDKNQNTKTFVIIVVFGFFLWRIIIYTFYRDMGLNDHSELGSGNRVLILIIPVMAFYIVNKLKFFMNEKLY